MEVILILTPMPSFPQPLAPSTQPLIGNPRPLTPGTCILVLTRGSSRSSLCELSHEKACKRAREGVRSRPGGGGKWVENRKKILNSGNEPKNILKAKELAFSGAQNELFFERKKAQSKRKMGPKCRKLEDRNWKIEDRN